MNRRQFTQTLFGLGAMTFTGAGAFSSQRRGMVSMKITGWWRLRIVEELEKDIATRQSEYAMLRAGWLSNPFVSPEFVGDRDDHEQWERQRLRWQMIRRLQVPENDPVWNQWAPERPLTTTPTLAMQMAWESEAGISNPGYRVNNVDEELLKAFELAIEAYLPDSMNASPGAASSSNPTPNTAEPASSSGSEVEVARGRPRVPKPKCASDSGNKNMKFNFPCVADWNARGTRRLPGSLACLAEQQITVTRDAGGLCPTARSPRCSVRFCFEFRIPSFASKEDFHDTLLLSPRRSPSGPKREFLRSQCQVPKPVHD